MKQDEEEDQKWDLCSSRMLHRVYR